MTNVVIRDAKVKDAASLLEIYRYYVENTAITFEIETPSLAVFQERMKYTMEKYPYIVIEKDARVIGYAYAGAFKERAAYDWSCELTIYLDHNVHKCGLGRTMYAALERKVQAMGILNLYTCIAYPETEDEYLNTNSADFHAHLGFAEVGRFHRCGYKFNRWYDMIWMEKIVGKHTNPPPSIQIYQKTSAR